MLVELIVKEIAGGAVMVTVTGAGKVHKEASVTDKV
jgi:hypothetical protein